jgi:hypothetical protein
MRIITSGHIHNPHYFAYMQANGGQANRPAGDMLCGGLPPPSIVQPARGQPKQPWMESAESIYRAIGHMFDVVGPRYQAHIREEDNRDYRVKYLLNDMSKAEIERILVIQERKRERERSIREVIDTFGNIGAEIFRRFAAESKRDEATWVPYFKELRGLRDYCNDEFMKISKHYKVVVPIIVERIVRYDPKGNHQVGWNIETENANRFTDRLDNTINEAEAKKAFEETIKRVDELNFDAMISLLSSYIDNPMSVTDATKFIADAFRLYDMAVKLKDSLPKYETKLIEKMGIKIDYYLVYYNQAWCINNMTSRLTVLNDLLARPATRAIVPDSEGIINTFYNLCIGSGGIHPKMSEAINNVKELIKKCRAASPELLHVTRSPWSDRAPALLNFEYNEETQKSKKAKRIEEYKELSKQSAVATAP